MFRSWKIGSAFGIGVYLHWSFLLLPLLIGWYDYQSGGAVAGALAVAVVLAVFGCVLLHELGHALMARLFGVGTHDITLYPIGGVARLNRMPERPHEELLIAVAGPLVNVIIAAGILFGTALAGMNLWSADVLEYGTVAESFLLKVLLANVVLVAFNLIPAFPMDGGRVLRSLLALGMDRLRATELAVHVGTVFAGLFIIGGLFGGLGPMLALVGLFVIFAGRQELMMLRYRERARQYAVWDVPTVVSADPVAPAMPAVPPGFSGFTWDRARGCWVQWQDGRAVGACYVGRGGPAW